MNSGLLRHRVALMKPVESTDQYGKTRVIYQQTAIVRAQIEPVAMYKQSYNSKQQSTTDYKIVLRFYADLDERWRIYWIAKDRTFDIASLLFDVTAAATMTLRCTGVA